MNREEGKELAKVLEHWGNGGAIQGRHDCCDWVNINADRFFPEMGVEYRIKPKPREWWAIVDENGEQTHLPFLTKETAELAFLTTPDKDELTLIHMREVT